MPQSTLNFFLAIVVIVVLIIIFCVMSGLICGGIVFLLMRLKKKAVDLYKLMYQEMIEESIINRQPHMKSLVRYPAPFFGRVLAWLVELREKLEALIKGTEKEKTVNADQLKPIAASLSTIESSLKEIKSGITGQTAVVLGEIIGYNKFDLQATVEDMDLPKKYTGSDRKVEKVDVERREVIKELLKKCGRYLHFIVYEKEVSGFLFFKKKIRQGVFAFEDQVTGLDSADGIVTLLGSGTNRIGVYFQHVTDYPERIDVLMAHLLVLSRIRLIMTLEGNMIEMVEKAVNLDSTFLKLSELAQISRKSESHSGGSDVKK